MLETIINTVRQWYKSGETFGQSCEDLSITASDNSITITLNRNKILAERFKKFINELDDDLFIKVCDTLGNETLHAINESLKTGDNLKENIDLFRKHLFALIMDQYNYYKYQFDKYVSTTTERSSGESDASN